MIRSGKWDIIKCFGDDDGIGLPISYTTMREPWGPPFTISQAFAHTQDCDIITGFPDILLDPPDVAERVIERLYSGNAEVVLATFICATDGSADRVDVDKSGRVVKLTPKEQEPAWGADPRTWMMLAWKPSFTRFFESTLVNFRMQLRSESESIAREWPMGSVLAAALQTGIAIDTVHFSDGRWHDIGTLERLAKAADFFSLTRQRMRIAQRMYNTPCSRSHTCSTIIVNKAYEAILNGFPVSLVLVTYAMMLIE